MGKLQHTSLGSASYPKESFIIHPGGTTITSENYKETQVVAGKAFKTKLPEKGHKEIIESFLELLDGSAEEMTREEQLEVMLVAFHVENELRET